MSLFAIAMAYLESAVVVYMRKLYYPEDILAIFPTRFMGELDLVLELGREAATVAMILAVALVAERQGFRRRFAAFVYVFGVWDLFYYFWLRVLIGWPRSWLEWDVLFLIPWIWLGPWICPALIALSFAIWGALVLLWDRGRRLSRRHVQGFVVGSLLAWIAFLQPAVPSLLRSGVQGMGDYVPGTFWWPLFGTGFGLMLVGLFGSEVRPRQPGAHGASSGES